MPGFGKVKLRLLNLTNRDLPYNFREFVLDLPKSQLLVPSLNVREVERNLIYLLMFRISSGSLEGQNRLGLVRAGGRRFPYKPDHQTSDS